MRAEETSEVMQLSLPSGEIVESMLKNDAPQIFVANVLQVGDAVNVTDADEIPEEPERVSAPARRRKRKRSLACPLSP